MRAWNGFIQLPVPARRVTLVKQIFVIMSKEWEDLKSTLFSRHNLLAGIWPVLLFCAAFGVYEPLKIGSEWLQSPMMVFSVSVLVPFVFIGFISPYTFVGERERGTLEPLLATPVSDQALLFGKIGMAVICGWVITAINLLLGLGSINFFQTNAGVLLCPPGFLVSSMLLSLLFSLLAASAGTNASLYAKTILEAQRNFVMLLFIPMLLPAFFVGPLAPTTWKSILFQILPQLASANLFPTLIVLLFILDCIFMVLVLTRYHRKQLLPGEN
jgi:ABC-2 type transport system permease protein